MSGIPEHTWHLDAELAAAYAAERTDAVLSDSLEQHLARCSRCRATVAPFARPDRLARTWVEVRERVERPRASLLERLLTRTGLDADTARLIALTPSLRGAWLGGVVVLLAITLVTAYADPHGLALFLAVAPLLPVAGVALTFGPATDPAHELVAATPYAALRLLAVRTAVVGATTLAPAALAGVLLPGSTWAATAWILPGLAMAVVVVAVGTRVSPVAVAAVLGLGWAALTAPGLRPRGNPLLATEPVVQVVCLLVLVLAVLVLLRDRRRLSELIRRIA